MYDERETDRLAAAALLEVRGLTVRIAGKTVCGALSLAIRRGQCWGILGSNGVGKTTLLHTLAGLRRPDTGEVLLARQPLATLSRRRIAQQVGVLLQQPPDSFPATVLETALMGRHPHLHAWQWERPEDLALARAALRSAELEGLEARQVDTLSGGERRRLALATVLTQDPEVYLLDEPASQLDLRHQMAMLTLLTERVRTTGRALAMSLHDLNLAVRFCDHLLLLFGDGEAACGQSDELLDAGRLERLYGYPVVALPFPSGTAYLPA